MFHNKTGYLACVSSIWVSCLFSLDDDFDESSRSLLLPWYVVCFDTLSDISKWIIEFHIAPNASYSSRRWYAKYIFVLMSVLTHILTAFRIRNIIMIPVFAEPKFMNLSQNFRIVFLDNFLTSASFNNPNSDIVFCGINLVVALLVIICRCNVDCSTGNVIWSRKFSKFA